MTPLHLVLVGTGILVLAAVVSLVQWRSPGRATRAASWGGVLGSLVGLGGAVAALARSYDGELTAPWGVPGGELVLGLDPLGAFFLIPLFALGGLCISYGPAYLGPRMLPAAGLDLLVGSMALVVLARHALLFVVAWEAMTLLAYLLVTVDDEDAQVRRAGWVFLIASHVAVVALLAAFVGMSERAGGALDFASLGRVSSVPTWALAAGLVGFGVKAGVFGLHVWLPEAHAAAPSHVSALMSGVLIKLGVYGMLRFALLAHGGAGWLGPALMTAGAAGAVLGIALALYQRDLKRVLAYSSVENVGIAMFGLGLGSWASSRGEAALSTLATAGGLLHLWNHAAMKGLLFLGAGSVLHGAGTRDLERLGGLGRRMPWTAVTVAVGAAAIAGLPPLCGFSGELLVYRALVAAARDSAPLVALAATGGAAALALAGGLALLCFVRLAAVAFLGEPRSAAASSAHESPRGILGPLVALATFCALAGVCAPLLVIALGPVLRELAGSLSHEVRGAASALLPVSVLELVLAVLAGGGVLLLLRSVRAAEPRETWACGYAAPSARMQYTASAVSELFSSRVLPRWARPRLVVRAPRGYLPDSAHLTAEATDPLTRRVYEPLLRRLGARLARARVLQAGNVNLYLLYILATAIGVLGWVALRQRLAP